MSSSAVSVHAPERSQHAFERSPQSHATSRARAAAERLPRSARREGAWGGEEKRRVSGAWREMEERGLTVRVRCWIRDLE